MSPQFDIFLTTWETDRDRLLSVREAVFVIEQGIPVEIEVDEYDPISVHVLACESENGTPIGTARLLPKGKIGRVAVLKSWRKQGVGLALMNALIDRAIANSEPELQIHAQSHTVGFYESCGFAVEGPEFMEEGIPHRKMRRVLV